MIEIVKGKIQKTQSIITLSVLVDETQVHLGLIELENINNVQSIDKEEERGKEKEGWTLEKEIHLIPL